MYILYNIQFSIVYNYANLLISNAKVPLHGATLLRATLLRATMLHATLLRATMLRATMLRATMLRATMSHAKLLVDGCRKFVCDVHERTNSLSE